MHFEPVLINKVFPEKDLTYLREILDSSAHSKSWIDSSSGRNVKKFPEIDEYFGKKLEPLAKKIFKDDSLKLTYSVYLDYDKPTSALSQHRDNNACRYTIDLCVSAKTPWGVTVEDKEFIFGPGEGLAFMGGYDSHGRNPMPDPENNRVEVIMFHFCPDDHWYFTEGPEYVYELADSGLLSEGDSYHLSPKRRNNTVD
jgi:hypothetical protein